MTSINFQVDRHFLFLHSRNLIVFAERVIRKSGISSDVPGPQELLDLLSDSCSALSAVLSNEQLKRKERTEAVREKEAQVLLSLGKLADYVESVADCKSDVYTTGFRPHLEHQKKMKEGVETRRRQRMTAKLARLETE